MRSTNFEELAQGVLKGNRRALARMITLVEARHPGVAQVMDTLFPHTGNGFVLGITGPPGAGKSTLTDRLIGRFRQRELTVGVVAIDPSSPFSGGALLGDRVRMMGHATDKNVFIRSLGSRGSYGGLSRATREIVQLMDAAGFDVVIVETVGVGQTELDVMDLADTVTVVFVPESGDVVQTMKAGLTEIADIFVVNKSDRSGADAMERELKQMVEYNPDPAWLIPVLRTVAIKDEGVDELVATIYDHKKYRETATVDPDTRRRLRINRFVDIFAGLLSDRILEMEHLEGRLRDISEEVAQGRLNPYAATQQILQDKELLAELALMKGASS